MVVIDCYIEDCDFKTPDLGETIAGTILSHHLSVRHPPPQAAKPPPLPLPRLAGQVSNEQFQEFEREWQNWHSSSNVEPAKTTAYLINCCEAGLKSDIQSAVVNITQKSETEVLAIMKQHAVLTRAKSSMITELLGSRQSEGESVRKFVARVTAIARNADLVVPCPNTDCVNHARPYVSFTDIVVKHVVINGLHDVDIRREVLGVTDLDDKTLAETIGLIEAKETAMRSMSGRASGGEGAGAAMSSYKRLKKIQTSDKRLQLTGKCETCDSVFKNRQLRQSKNKDDEIRVLKLCEKCWSSQRKNKGESKSGKQGADSVAVNNADKTDQFLAAACSEPVPGQQKKCRRRRRKVGRSSPNVFLQKEADTGGASKVLGPILAGTSESVPAMMWDSQRGWVRRSEGHGKVVLTANTVKEDYDRFGLKFPATKPTTVTAVCDSGCQAPLMGTETLYRLGLGKKDLVRVDATATAINNRKIDILGVIMLRFRGTDDVSGKSVETAAQVRVASDVRDLYISKQMMRDLGIIGRDFPNIQAAGVSAADVKEPCGCPRRSPPPSLPETLPFEPKEENVGKMKAWILQQYASSAFNQCTHVPLPMMNCEPIRIHIKPDAKPVAAMTASTVPVHLREAVQKQLDDDVALGILERVPIGTKTAWQARMHVVTKHDGTPRRTVDLRHLNDHCVRETEHIVPPYKQARLIPRNVWKSKTDAWNGYHSCPLDKRDRHLTTFITEKGRYWYAGAPQGFLASGDGYNQRYGRLIEGMERQTRCVDDLAMWDEDMEAHWWRVLKYLDTIGRNGIIISAKKFEFCAREIEFAGFLVTDNEVKPLPKYLDAIENFPRPEDITGTRSFFGLVNQVSHYAKLSDLMAPFKPFLSPKVRFQWNDELEDAFVKARKEIVAAIKEGVEIFEPGRTTALSPDWSKTGIGYFLYQKYCSCQSTVTTCCDHGWRVVLAGSRFLSAAERNYWPTEGEMLAVCWALEDTKFFTIGCTDLHVQTDHRPLVKLLGDRTLDEIQNRRLVNLKEKTFPWSFKISWVPGRSIPAADATSRHPQRHGGDGEAAAVLEAIRTDVRDQEDLAGETEMAAAAGTSMKQFKAVTWDRVKEETGIDRDMQELVQVITAGFHNGLDELPRPVAQFWRHRETLNVVDGVVMLGERVVIPPRLRKEILRHLHGAHQGVSQMTARATTAVYWPGMLSDIQATRDECLTCDKIAPSQRQTHPVPPVVPMSPFEAVCSDFFDLAGNHYLITVDRMTGWVDVRRAKPQTGESGTPGLMDMCREMFRCFGVPLELASDGGPEYSSREFNDFLQRWGVRHRVSSAYHASSNGRAEVAVKATKRALRDNTDADGSVDNDAVTRALLLMRNTPDRETGKSPAELLLGRPLRDTLPHPWNRDQVPRNRGVGEQPIHNHWHDMWDEQEHALRHRLGKVVDKLEAKAHDLPALELSDHVRVQNQGGNSPRRWDRSGVVVGRNLQLDKYWVKMDGSRRVTERNRKFLRKIKPSTYGLEVQPEPWPPVWGQKQDLQKQDQKQDLQKQDPLLDLREAGPCDAGQQELPAGPATPGQMFRTPGTPAFSTPPTSPAGPPPPTSPARSPPVAPGGATPARGQAPRARQVRFGDQEQGSARWAAPEEPAAAAPPPKPATNDRPQRQRKRPSWQTTGEFDMETSSMCVRCCGVDDDTSVGGMIGMEDDYDAAAEARPAGWPGRRMRSDTCLGATHHEDGVARELLDKLVQLVGKILAGQVLPDKRDI